MNKLQKWIPDRKILAGGLGGVATFFALTALSSYTGFDEAVTAQVAGVVGVLIAYFVKSSNFDLLKRADDTLKAYFEDEKDEKDPN